ncbi:dual-specificity RNA methyltransferase RlmN isoform X2 [Jatropha curcas]|uniref:dual-specificity RNA methyltransferase RlmN isoform X2 n=1 Tax=Jatropha curcas TaxID=180498 RepID=UPI001893AFD9|nr:dual-specificity RNA methyltransferase RlmN isoform X2 [Jatropha curcas]
MLVLHLMELRRSLQILFRLDDGLVIETVVIKAADIMVHEQDLHFSPRNLHFSPRKVTVSTSGLVPQLKRFLHESNCALAVSLNATADEVRNWIVPINRKYNLGLLLDTLRKELQSIKNCEVLFEYVMLAGVNDRK